MIDPGKYKHLVVLKRLDATTGVWSDLPNTPAKGWHAFVEPLGDEKYRVQMPYRTDVRGFKDTHPTMRVYWRDRVADVRDVVEAVEHEEIYIFADGHQIETENLEQGARRTQAWPS